MKRGILILLAIPVYLILSSKSCDSDREHDALVHKAKTEQTKESIREEFQSEYLTDQTLRAFELKAKQKLVDFADYLSIYYNKKLDEALKNQAGEMVTGLFASDKTVIQSFFPGKNNSIGYPLSDFLGHDFMPEYNTVNVLIDSICIDTPLQRSGHDLYKGTLTFYRRLEACSPSDTIMIRGNKMNIEIIAKKVNKSFGSDTLQVWSVFLGNIRQNW
ncbi:MAG: hypothetical protein V1775_19360 [Bacteroidota bacterium]